MSVALIGDSVLDNFYWLNDHKKDLKFRLNELHLQCENYAVDESQLKDVLTSIYPNPNYVRARTYPYPMVDGKVTPLTLLEQLQPEVIILSVGGNDLRVKIANLMYGPDFFINSVVTPTFKDDYEKLIIRLKSLCKKLIIVSVYSPCLTEGIYKIVSPFADPIFNLWFKFLNNLCVKHNIPILDLYRTFDNTNRSHYGTTIIEPSDTATVVMAQILKTMIEEWNGHKVYYAPNFGELVRE